MMEQLSFFNEPPLKIHNKVRLIELFSGIGAQAKAMERLGVDFEHWRAYDIDKYAVASYNAIHGTQFEVGDITKIHAEDLGIVDRDKYTYIMTYSFPCQDLSLAGRQKGMSKGSGTRSGLLWEVERLLKECKDNLPQILLMENVAQVISIKNKADFDAWRESLRELGYSNLYQLMNAKNYLIPQNRERCFMLSWIGDYSFEFPNQMPLQKKLKDLLEDNADEKYYLAESTLKYFINNSALQKSLGNGFTFEPTDGNGVCKAVTTHMTRMDCTFIDETSKGGLPIIGDNNPSIIHLKNGEVIDSNCDTSKLRIRKLTPKECFRLMDFDDEDYEKASKVVSNTQIYKQAGNSIVVNVLVAIFGRLFEGKEDVYKQK